MSPVTLDKFYVYSGTVGGRLLVNYHKVVDILFQVRGIILCILGCNRQRTSEKVEFEITERRNFKYKIGVGL